MRIQVTCKGCNARYEVASTLAGRVAECRHCAQRFVVPYRSPVIRLEEESCVEQPENPQKTRLPVEPNKAMPARQVATRQPAAAARLASKPAIEDEAFDESALFDLVETPVRSTVALRQSGPILPDNVTFFVIPLLVVIIAMGWSLTVAIQAALASDGPLLGMMMVGLAVLLFTLGVVPLTVRAVSSAADTMELQLPDAVWFQTFALVSLPAAGLTLGYFSGGVSMMITFGIVGLGIMAALMAVLYRATAVQAAMTALFGGVCFALSATVSAGIVATVAFCMARAGLISPWAMPFDHSDSQVATITPPAPSGKTPASPAPVASTEPVAFASIAAPPPPILVQATTAPAIETPAAPTESPWVAVNEPFPASVRWPVKLADVHLSLEVSTPTAAIYATNGGPFVAIVEATHVNVWDLRTGRHAGFISGQFNPADALLSTDGTLLAINPGNSSYAGSPIFQMNQPTAAGWQVWSTADSHMIGQIPRQTDGLAPQPVGFSRQHLLMLAGPSNQRKLELRDPQQPEPLYRSEITFPYKPFIAVSGGGRFAATIINQSLKICDLDTGKVVAQRDVPNMTGTLHSLSFSPDGSDILAVMGDGTGALRAVTWDAATGKMERDVPMHVAESELAYDPMLAQWMPTLGTPAQSTAVHWNADANGWIVGNNLIDRYTGTIVFIFPPQTAGLLQGRVCEMAGTTALYEFRPSPSGSRLIYRSIALPEPQITAAIAAARQNLPSEQQKLVAQHVQIASTLPAAPAATQPSSGVAIAAPTEQLTFANAATQKQWVVSVKSVTKSDAVALAAQVAAEQQRMQGLQSASDAAKAYAISLSSSRQYVDDTGEIHNLYSSTATDRAAANAKSAGLKADLIACKQNLVKLQNTSAAAPTSRTVIAVLENGMPVQIDTDNMATSILADGMIAGDSYQITGLPRIVDGVLEVKLRSVVPVKP